jgi:hypothetical protein
MNLQLEHNLMKYNVLLARVFAGRLFSLALMP